MHPPPSSLWSTSRTPRRVLLGRSQRAACMQSPRRWQLQCACPRRYWRNKMSTSLRQHGSHLAMRKRAGTSRRRLVRVPRRCGPCLRSTRHWSIPLHARLSQASRTSGSIESCLVAWPLQVNRRSIESCLVVWPLQVNRRISRAPPSLVPVPILPEYTGFRVGVTVR